MTLPVADFSISALRNVDITPLCSLAREIWLQHYPGIITVKQIEYMLAQRYSSDIIGMQLHTGQAWWDKLEVCGELCGFASYERGHAAGSMKLDKIYVHQTVRGKGYGAALIEHVAGIARRQGMEKLYLQVNKYNHRSVAAYLRAGFAVANSVTVDIGRGFVMDDYVMEKTLRDQA